MDNYIGKKIEGRYQITELIGVGGMANVYKAIDVSDGKTVAVKILREEFYDNEEFLRRFKNESKAIALLSHPNIIQVFDVVFSNRMQSIVMEYIDGITLKEYMEQQGKLPWKEALHFVFQILTALSHAHDKGIVHRAHQAPERHAPARRAD
jgi:serine/threonine-protein kinase